ncbi:MAG TPA: glycosyltransferase [Longimicrobiales bacterium]|nr:glycosyltransferase [Longimicrobiales bacterium]
MANVVWKFDLGGLERVVAELGRTLDPATFDLSVLSLGGGGTMAEAASSSRLRVRVPSPQGRLSLLRPAALAADLRRLGPDIVHSHSGVWLKAAYAARLAGVPGIVHTDHGRPHPDRLTARIADRFGARLTDRVIAVSPPLAEYLSRRIVGGGRTVQVICNGVDTDRFVPGDPAAIRGRLGIPLDGLVVGSVGRLEPVKAYDSLIRAFGMANEALGEPVHLVLVGDGSQHARLLDTARAASYAERIHLVGRQDAVPEWLAGFDIFALTSLSEGTSMSLLEAMACACCPVVTAVGGTPDVLGPALAHRLVRPGDDAAFGRALADALLDRARRERDMKRARDRVVEAYALQAMADAYEKVYRSMLDRLR